MLQSFNIELPDETLNLLDELSPDGDRPAIVAAAIQHYVKFLQTESLREQVKAGAIERAERDRQMAEEWFPLEEEICHDPIA
jgi:CopG family transcriptional regulator / antitoxin EndoAI